MYLKLRVHPAPAFDGILWRKLIFPKKIYISLLKIFIRFTEQ